VLNLFRRVAPAVLGAVSLMAFSPGFAPPLFSAFVAPQGGPKLTTAGIVLVLGFLILSLGIHEAAHGWVAWKRGDSTAKDLGRITLNPIPHIDPFMTIILPAAMYFLTNGRYIFGGAKPVPVQANRLRHPLRDMVLVALAGPGSNFLLAVLFLVAWKSVMASGSYSSDQVLPQVLLASMQFNVVLAIFNLLPIPPLDGSRVMNWLLPPTLRPAYSSLERWGLLVIFGLLYIRSFNVFLSNGIQSTIGFLDRMTGGAWSS
jgi:Zn-dependent protease